MKIKVSAFDSKTLCVPYSKVHALPEIIICVKQWQHEAVDAGVGQRQIPFWAEGMIMQELN